MYSDAMREIMSFLRVVGRDTWVFMSTACLALSAAQALPNEATPSQSWAKQAFWLLAIVCFAMAMYRAWRTEHRAKLEAERRLASSAADDSGLKSALANATLRIAALESEASKLRPRRLTQDQVAGLVEGLRLTASQ